MGCYGWTLGVSAPLGTDLAIAIPIIAPSFHPGGVRNIGPLTFLPELSLDLATFDPNRG
jgi:hypothetical protein